MVLLYSSEEDVIESSRQKLVELRFFCQILKKAFMLYEAETCLLDTEDELNGFED